MKEKIIKACDLVNYNRFSDLQTTDISEIIEDIESNDNV